MRIAFLIIVAICLGLTGCLPVTELTSTPVPTPIPSVTELTSTPIPIPTSVPSTPDAFPPTEEQIIGAYHIRVWNQSDKVPARLKNGINGTATISNKDREWVVNNAIGIRVLPVQDITGEGQPDVMFYTYDLTGGGHCCSGIVMYNLGPAPGMILTLWAGSNGNGTGWIFEDGIRDLDGDGKYELIGNEIVPIEWSNIPKNESSCTPPETGKIVLRYTPQGYIHVGQEFPELYKDEIVQQTQLSDGQIDLAKSGYKCTGVLSLVLAYLYSGQTEKAWSEFSRLYTAPDASDFRKEIERALSRTHFFSSGLVH